MADTVYDASTAADYRAAREIPREGLTAWREAIAEHAAPSPGATVLDVGAGTGAFATALRDWFGVHVVAVEPAPAMRELIPVREGITVLDGRAEQLPVADAGADAAWLGSVVHHIGYLTAAARELHRALRPGGTVLIRNAFPGRCERDLRVRYFPETAAGIADYPTVEHVTTAFEAAGFTPVALRALPQRSAPTLAAFAAGLRRDADSKLRALPDEAWQAGLDRLRRAAAERPEEEAVSWMDLLVLRRD